MERRPADSVDLLLQLKLLCNRSGEWHDSVVRKSLPDAPVVFLNSEGPRTCEPTCGRCATPRRA
ncbi:hypothetical protein [Enorma phocaeensis]|uniref:Uncharacterized protein n=1 Tax=Enorma phocaeensis TaxID=1871019 RepID=A0ABT7VCD1_9ACTN|nr:hypothetical protein [Enorma phocaeensis]MDM8275534.1 hypothetical protein [Enorma phocaeensis]